MSEQEKTTRLEELKQQLEELKSKYKGKKCKRDGCDGTMTEMCYNYFVCDNKKCYHKSGVKTTNQKTIEKFEKHKRLHEKRIKEAMDDYEEALEEYNKNNITNSVVSDDKQNIIDISGNVTNDYSTVGYYASYCVIS